MIRKKTVSIILMLGMLLTGAGMLHAATLAVTANVQSVLSLVLTPTTMSFDAVTPGVATTAQTLTATTSGTGAYQLQLQGAAFTGPSTQAASVLEFKESTSGTYKQASTTAQNMLSTNGTATAGGDAKTFDIRLNFPASAPNGTYSANITITAAPM